ncbi:unnamed protein product [Phyllotreta striolata]|uniref:Uncharacterized protein n=1 Tax=Phyllotreta striolata TaxID=444603 RepID=A0A9N9U0W9_PHYSR|nr:unnamed protein product [Phyllotreta striolata]
MYTQTIQEEAKLDAMQRHWLQLRRGPSSSTAFFEAASGTENLFSLPLQNSLVDVQRSACLPVFKNLSCDLDSDSELLDLQDLKQPKCEKPAREPLVLNASVLGDIPGVYTVCALEPHQLPVAGVYIDRSIVPGFKYRVRPLPAVGAPSTINGCLFGGRALTLKSIGRGYARRFTFHDDKSLIRDEDCYFWSDNRPEGYAFEPELLSEGDEFTIFNSNGEPEGTVEVLTLEGPQIEIFSSVSGGGVAKKADVRFTGKVEYYETGVAKPMHLDGTVSARLVAGQSSARIVKVTGVKIGRRRFYLLPGVQKIHRRVTVRGGDIKDVPTKYTMTGLESYELPVVGTYVDPRITPGFCYKVRPNDRKERLFNGEALKLMSIGMGYAKRLTFEPTSLVNPDNYLWSDSHPDGLGLEPRAVHKGMKFDVKAGDIVLGEAEVFRDDLPQIEEQTEKIKTANGTAIQKYIYVDVFCHVRLARTGGASTENEEYLMRVSGLAVVRKEPKEHEAKVIRVEHVGLDSHLLLIFAQTHTELTLVPKSS